MNNKTKYKELTNEQLQRKIKQWEKERALAYKLPTYNEFVERINELGRKFYEYHLEENMRKKPNFHPYSMFDDDVKITLDEFVQRCKSGLLTSYDGYGAYASDEGVSDILISPDDVELDYYRKDFPYICWYNK